MKDMSLKDKKLTKPIVSNSLRKSQLNQFSSKSALNPISSRVKTRENIDDSQYQIFGSPHVANNISIIENTPEKAKHSLNDISNYDTFSVEQNTVRSIERVPSPSFKKKIEFNEENKFESMPKSEGASETSYTSSQIEQMYFFKYLKNNLLGLKS